MLICDWSIPRLAQDQAATAGDLWLDFTTGALPAQVIWARGSEASCFDAAGRIVTRPAGAARFDHDPVTRAALGVLVEPTATNLLAQSAIAAPGWTLSGATMTALSLAALGVFAGASVVSAGASWHRAMQNFAVTAGVAYAVTLFYRPGSSGKMTVILKHNASSLSSNIEGAIGGLAVTATAAGALAGLEERVLADGVTRRLRVVFASGVSGTLSLGAGPFSAVAGQDVILLGAQVEAGTSASAYIATAGSLQARAADRPGLTGITGRHDVTLRYGDGTQETLPVQIVSEGYWPELSRSDLAAIGLSPR